ncbi:ABC transporter ATP-binding protein [Anaerosporobacter sp.]|uniref:ABC transporter ATP-binding protein n=1 Tax=Anaerosporobacter sp. TaxID=1872529 RepID=UPI00286F37EC|nr:ABC transporter ATP-binding protein [Anaerosporobacter sp.]
MRKDLLLAGRLSAKLLKGNKLQLYTLMIIIMVFKVEVTLMMPLIIKYSFSAMAAGDRSMLFGVTVIGVLVLAANFAIMYFINVYGNAWATKFSFHAAENTFKEMSGLPLWTVKKNYQNDDLFQRIAAGTGNIMGLYFTLADILSNTISVALLVVMLFGISPEIGLVALAMVAIVLICVKMQFSFNDKYSNLLQRDNANTIEKANSLILSSSFHKKNQTEKWMRNLYGESRSTYLNTQECKLNGNLLFDAFQGAFTGVFKVGLAWNFMINRESVKLFVEDIVSSFIAFDSLCSKASELGNNIAVFPNSLVPINRLGEVLEQSSVPVDCKRQGVYSLEDVCVSMNEKKILNDITCHIPEKSKIAIIGENGSGKSTLLKVIAGLCECDDGKVMHLKERMGYMPADDLLFYEHTVLQNIRYGNCDFSEKDSIKALEDMGIGSAVEFINRLARETSGGETKRVNLIRGLYGDSEILLADEPTSSLDEESADKAMKTLLSLDKTVVYITHSPKFALLADYVIIMEDGSIKENLKKEDCWNNPSFLKWALLFTKNVHSNGIQSI